MVFNDDFKNKVATGEYPIYVIVVMEKDGKERKNGFSDFGAVDNVGFYYSYTNAIVALHTNSCDMHECCYNYAMVERVFPGLYTCIKPSDRTFFKWDEEKRGFFEIDEPEEWKGDVFTWIN